MLLSSSLPGGLLSELLPDANCLRKFPGCSQLHVGSLEVIITLWEVMTYLREPPQN